MTRVHTVEEASGICGAAIGGWLVGTAGVRTATAVAVAGSGWKDVGVAGAAGVLFTAGVHPASVIAKTTRAYLFRRMGTFPDLSIAYNCTVLGSTHQSRGSPMFTRYSREADFAAGAVRRAAELCRSIQQEMVTPALSKTDHSPVTVADFASQAFFARLLLDEFPSDALVAEEASQALKKPEAEDTLEAVTRYVGRVSPGATADQVCRWIDHGSGQPATRFWTCDPIDGTKGFLRGDQYVAALALIVEGKVVVAALGCPNLNADLQPEIGGPGIVVLAVRGEGTWSMPLPKGSAARLRVSTTSTPSEARVLRSFESGHTDSSKIKALLETLGIGAEPVLMDSQAKYALLAGGSGELLFRLLSPGRPDYREKIWDQAAGSLIVEEAGGEVTDLHGLPLDFTRGRQLEANFGVLASNGALHQAALAAIRTVGADQRPGPR